MFTGLVEEKGRVLSLHMSGVSGRLSIAAYRVLEGTEIGDSIAVNGVCLTVTALGSGSFEADVMSETLRRSSLSGCRAGDDVNLERALALGGRLGGHIVTGHIDGTGTITEIKPEGNAIWYTIQASPQIMKYVAEKGSIAVDGISLTVAYADDRQFKVSVIPHTGEATTLTERRTGDMVNLENDILAKYVEKLLTGGGMVEKGLSDKAYAGLGSSGQMSTTGSSPEQGGSLTMEYLVEQGF